MRLVSSLKGLQRNPSSFPLCEDTGVNQEVGPDTKSASNLLLDFSVSSTGRDKVLYLFPSHLICGVLL